MVDMNSVIQVGVATVNWFYFLEKNEYWIIIEETKRRIIPFNEGKKWIVKQY